MQGKPSETPVRTVVERMLNAGIPPSVIVNQTGCSYSYAYRIRDILEAQGKLNVIRWKRGSQGQRSISISAKG